ncbi:MAG: tryptophan synthase subunit beta, partial [Bacteroidota bacterium]
ASLDTILEKTELYGLDYVQLHGDESPGFCAAVDGFVPVIKAFRVGEGFDFEALGKYEAACSYFLFDTKGKNYGGNGTKFDWDLLNGYAGSTPFLLSGGIGPEDAEIVRAFEHPRMAGVDLNSGFEMEPGLKDIAKVKEFREMIGKTNTENTVNAAPGSLKFPDEFGHYGEFGGAFIPEMLIPNVEALAEAYTRILAEPDFQAEFKRLLEDYAGRPTPLFLAERLSERYGATIYLKREDLNHTGAHKLNNTIGQVLLAERMGKKRIIAETGAGQHGVATATVCALKGLECIVYMGAVDMARQAPNVARMRMLGAKVVPAVSGSQTLKDATNEAIRDWISHPEETHYIIGSVVGPHPYPDMVTRFQSIISEEMRRQLTEKTGSPDPDMVIACVGGGSNAAGAFFHYLDRPEVELVIAEAAGEGVDTGKSAATSFLGRAGVLHGSMTLLMQDADGQVIEPHSISAGLDYPGMGPLHAHLLKSRRATALAITDAQALAAGFELARLEGIIPALESAHALACLPHLELRPDQCVVVNLSGRGDKDLQNYLDHFDTFDAR